MIDALLLPCQLKGVILQLGPVAAHGLDLRPARAGSVKNAGLVGQPLGGQDAGGGQDMGMMIALIALAVRCMDGHICRHAKALDELLCESAGDFTIPDEQLRIRFWECLRTPKYPLVSGEEARALIEEHPADRQKLLRADP